MLRAADLDLARITFLVVECLHFRVCIARSLGRRHTDVFWYYGAGVCYRDTILRIIQCYCLKQSDSLAPHPNFLRQPFSFGYPLWSFSFNSIDHRVSPYRLFPIQISNEYSSNLLFPLRSLIDSRMSYPWVSYSLS